jgi:hypothetical protein
MKSYSKISILMRLQMAYVGGRGPVRRLLSTCDLSRPVPLFPLNDQSLISFISFLYPRLKRVEMLKVDIHLTLCLRKERLDIFIENARMCSKICKDKMCMSEEQEIGLFVVAFVFVYLCLKSPVSPSSSHAIVGTDLLQ